MLATVLFSGNYSSASRVTADASLLTVTKIKGKSDAFTKVKLAAELKTYFLELKEYTSCDLKHISNNADTASSLSR
jgi:hypothetical protein